jgi:glycosyltransferase involved in cell wall biosynthesis
MEDVIVSVCMVTYNQERYIAQAIESALAQRTTFLFEIVVGEDYSTDSTRAIVRDFASRHPDRIRLRLAETNEGGKRNFMQTFAECRGKYVTILEGDDYWTSCDKLQLQVDALEANPDWAICFHPTQCIYEDGNEGPAMYPENWDRRESELEDLFERNFMLTSSVVFRNRLFPELPSWFGEIILGDWPLHLLNAAHGKIGFLPQVMSAYRIHAGGAHSSRSTVGKIEEVFQMLTAVDHHFDGKYSKQIDAYRLSTVRWLDGKIESSRQYLEKVITTAAAEKHTLIAEIQVLRQFRDLWQDSVAFRVLREATRPWQQLTKLVNGRRTGVKPTLDQATTNRTPA